jgi:hypothetical protein
MMQQAYIAVMSVGLACLSSVRLSSAAGQKVEPLKGVEWVSLGMVTGFHSVLHKKSGFEARIIEADGSASVARDPVSLFLVVTNNGTGDRVERFWRLPRTVQRVRRLSATDYGIDIKVEVDQITENGLVDGTIPKVLHLHFLSVEGKLQTKLRVSETSR